MRKCIRRCWDPWCIRYHHAGQTIRLECPSSQVAGHILPITYTVHQYLMELDILKILGQPSVGGQILLNASTGKVSWTYSLGAKRHKTSVHIRHCYGTTGCPSKAGQTLRLECPSNQVIEYILPITYRVPQSLVELDILQFLECPSLQWLDRFYSMPRLE